MTVKIDGTNGIDTAQLRAPDGDPVAITIDVLGKLAFPAQGQSLTPDGYVKLPGGLIIQWGLSTNTNSVGIGYMGQAFPIPFPNECLTVNCQTITGGPTFPSRGCSLASISMDPLGFSWINYDAANAVSGGGDSIRWIAIGH